MDFQISFANFTPTLRTAPGHHEAGAYEDNGGILLALFLSACEA
jgi:hypothetical protein